MVTHKAAEIKYVRRRDAARTCDSNPLTSLGALAPLAARSWKQYKIDPKAHKIGVVVSTVSTKLPFVSMGKESISADVEDVAVVIRVRALLVPSLGDGLARMG